MDDNLDKVKMPETIATSNETRLRS